MEYQILNYEQQILTNSQIRQLERPQDPSLFTFQEWGLSNIISSVMSLPRSEISLRWVGNSLYSITLSFFYSAFRLCILRPEFILYLKHNVYRIGQYYLSLAEQKSLAHFLSSLSEGIDVAESLCENRNIQLILIKLVQTLSSSNIESLFQLEEFAKAIFPFLSVKNISPQATVVSIAEKDSQTGHQCIYIFQEKMCFFVCQPLQQSKIRLQSYSPSSLNKKLATPIQQEEGQQNSFSQSDARIPSFLADKHIGKRSQPSGSIGQESIVETLVMRKPLLDSKIKRLLSHSNLSQNSKRIFEEVKRRSKSKNNSRSRKNSQSEFRNSINKDIKALQIHNRNETVKTLAKITTSNQLEFNHSPKTKITSHQKNRTSFDGEDTACNGNSSGKKNGEEMKKNKSPRVQRYSHNERMMMFSQKSLTQSDSLQQLGSEKVVKKKPNFQKKQQRYYNVEEEQFMQK